MKKKILADTQARFEELSQLSNLVIFEEQGLYCLVSRLYFEIESGIWQQLSGTSARDTPKLGGYF